MLDVVTSDIREESVLAADSLENLRETNALQALNLLHKRNRELYDLKNRVDRYLHVNSHDLRGPVVQILGLISLLQADETLGEEARLLVGLLERSAAGLDEIVRDLNELLAAE